VRHPAGFFIMSHMSDNNSSESIKDKIIELQNIYDVLLIEFNEIKEKLINAKQSLNDAKALLISKNNN
jgi:hypothetical protein